MTQSSPLLDQDVAGLLALCSVSTEAVARTFWPEAFSRPFDEGHREIFRVLDDDSIKKVLILAPRGIGKTSLVMKAFLLRQILFQLKRHIVPIGSTFEMVTNQTESVRFLLEHNGLINRLFPKLKSSKRWAIRYWQTEWPGKDGGMEFGTAIFPRGSDQPVRGLLQGIYRPDLVVMDDAQEEKHIENPEYVKKLLKRLDTDILECFDKTWENCRIIYIATILKPYDVPSVLMKRKSWKTIFLDLCEDDCTTLWPNQLSTEEILRRQNVARDEGTLVEWLRENRNQIIGGELAIFKEKNFQYYNLNDDSGEIVSEEELQKPHIVNVVLVDPAKKDELTSCDSAIVGIALDMMNSRIYVRDILAGKMQPDKLIDETFDMCERLGATHYGVEVTGLDMFVSQPFQDENARRRLGLQFIALKSKGGPGATGKKGRVGELAPYYRRGLVHHNSHCCHQLEVQLLSYPNSLKWDVMDAAAYAVYVMHELQLHMGGFAKDDDDEAVEAELKLIDDGLEAVEDWGYYDVDVEFVPPQLVPSL